MSKKKKADSPSSSPRKRLKTTQISSTLQSTASTMVTSRSSISSTTPSTHSSTIPSTSSSTTPSTHSSMIPSTHSSTIPSTSSSTTPSTHSSMIPSTSSSTTPSTLSSSMLPSTSTKTSKSPASVTASASIQGPSGINAKTSSKSVALLSNPSKLSHLVAALKIGPVDYKTVDHIKISNTGYPIFLQNSIILNNPITGPMFVTEKKIFDLTKTYCEITIPKCGSKYFDYTILSAEALMMEQMSFLTFAKAFVYQGKGEGFRPFDHFVDLDAALEEAKKQKKALEKSKALKQIANNIANKDTKAPAKLFALNKLMEARKNCGLVLLVTFTHISEPESFCREAAVIDLLKKQLVNHEPGNFRGLYSDACGQQFFRHDINKRHGNKKKLIVNDQELKDYQISTLFRCYRTFMQQNNNIITVKNYKDLVAQKSLKCSSTDQTNIFSLYNFLYSKPVHSAALRDLIILDNLGPNNEKLFQDINHYFCNQEIGRCFIFLILDGYNIDEFQEEPNVSFTEYLDAIFCIGIHNDMNGPFNLMKGGKNRPSEIFIQQKLTQIHETEEKEKGLFLHTMFFVCSEDDAIFKKGAMLAALNRNFHSNELRKKIPNLIAEGVCNSLSTFLQYGSVCLFKAFKAFKGLPPRRLVKADVY